MHNKIAQVVNRVDQLFKISKELFDVDLSETVVRFDLRGRVAGYATLTKQEGQRDQLSLRFNTDMMQNGGLDTIINDTVPHEISHLICMLRPELGRNHDRGWQTVCRMLGGSGSRTHNQPVVYAKGRTYLYTTTTGHQVALSEQRHRKVQTGSIYSVRDKGFLNAQCDYELYAVKPA